MSRGVIALEGADSGPVPTALAALTVNVYAVPFVNPVTVVDVAGGEPVTVVAVCAIAAISFAVSGYTGYTIVLIAVGLAAAVNLLPPP